MAIRRLKLDRSANLTLDGGRVIDMPPGWVFTINCQHHGKFDFDFNPYRNHGRDDLAGHMRDAIWSLRHESVGNTLEFYKKAGLDTFWRFLNELQAAGESITRLDQVDRKLLDRFLAWLEHQLSTTGERRGRKLSVGTQKKYFDSLKALLSNRQKISPSAMNPAISYPLNPFPNSNRLRTKREAYSVAEQERIIASLNTDLRTIHEGERVTLRHSQVLAVHMLLLGLTTGRNVQSLLELRRDSLQEHPIPDMEILVTNKRRGWSTHASSIRKHAKVSENCNSILPIPATIGDHLRFLREFTASLANDATGDNREFVFLCRISSGERRGEITRLNIEKAYDAVVRFGKRHALLDDRGQRLKLNLARMRPTFGNEIYRRTRDIRCVQQALGHASAETTASHYVDTPMEAERDHAIVLDVMVSQFTRMEIDGKVLLAADGHTPLQNVQDLLSGGYNTGIARCRNPFRENGTVCKKFFPCFTCPSMIVFEDDLWRLFSFYYRLLSERAKITPPQWIRTYGPIIRRIDVDIAPLFPADTVGSARIKAQQSPHPAWKGPLI